MSGAVGDLAYVSRPAADVAVDAVVAAVRGRRGAAVRRVLDAAGEALGPGPCIDRVLMPAVRRIGGQGHKPEPADVGLAVETARAWLESVTARAPAPHARPPLVLACGPGDRHSLGLEALAALLRYRRQPCRLLGAGVTARKISVAVEVNRPAGAVIVALRGSGHRAGADVLRALLDTGTTAFYAGAAFDMVDARQDVPGIYLGTSFQGACSTILRTLLAERPRATPGTG